MDAVGGSVYPADGDSTQKQAALQKAFRRAINDAQASGVIVIGTKQPTDARTEQTPASAGQTGHAGQMSGFVRSVRL